MKLRSRLGLTVTLFVYGLLRFTFGELTDPEYDIDSVYPSKADSYENEMIVRNFVFDDSDGPDEDTEGEDEEDNVINEPADELISSLTTGPAVSDPQEFVDYRSEKRDRIRGPSFSPDINDESADSDLALENSEVSLAGKRSGPNKYADATGRKYSDIEQMPADLPQELPLKDNEVDEQITETASKKTITDSDKGNSYAEDIDELKAKDPAEEKGRQKNTLAHTRSGMSEDLIKLLYDWKKHKLPRNPDDKSDEAEKMKQDEVEAARTVSKLRAASHESEDFSAANKDATSDATKSSAVSFTDKELRPANEDDAEEQRSSEGSPVSVTTSTEDERAVEPIVSAASRKSKGKINVMVNVNIDERPVSRSKVPRNNGTGSRNDDRLKATEDPNAKKRHKSARKGSANVFPVQIGNIASVSNDLSMAAKQVNWEQAFSDVAKEDDEADVHDKSDGGDSESASGDESGGSASGDFENVAMVNRVEADANMDQKESIVAVAKNAGRGSQDEKEERGEGGKKFGKGSKDVDETGAEEKEEQDGTAYASKPATKAKHENKLEHKDAMVDAVTKVKASGAHRLTKEEEPDQDREVKTHGALLSKSQTRLDSKSSHTGTKGNARKLPLQSSKQQLDQENQRMAKKPIPQEANLLSSGKSSKHKENENDEIEFTRAEKEMREKSESRVEEQTLKNGTSENDGSGNSETEESGPEAAMARNKNNHDGGTAATDSKYGSLEQVREKFKTWETKLLKNVDSEKSDSIGGAKVSDGKNAEKANHKMADETKNKKFKHQDNSEESSGDKDTVSEVTGSHSSKVKDQHQEGFENQDGDEDVAHADQAQSWKKEEKLPDAKSKKPNVSQHQKVKLMKSDQENDDISEASTKSTKAIKDKKLIEKSKAVSSDENHNLKQLAIFKEQILAEVKKIDKLRLQYLKEDQSTTELDKAKGVLQKDLKVVKQLEKNLKKKPTVSGKIAAPFHNETLRLKAKKKENKASTELLTSAGQGKKKHPLEEIHSLLREEIRRLKTKKQIPGKHDHQLANIRRLVQQKLKVLVTSSSLNRAEMKSLAPEIKELGLLLKKKMRDDKRQRENQKKLLKSQDAQTSKLLLQESDVQKPVRPALDSSLNKAASVAKAEAQPEKQAKQAPTKAGEANPQSGEAEKSLEKVQSALNKFPPNKTSSPADIQQAATQLSDAQETLTNLANNPNSLATSENKLKTLLSTLNSKLGEIYSKVQSGIANQLSPAPSNASNTSALQMTNGVINLPTSTYGPNGTNQAMPPVSNIFIPANGQGITINGQPIRDAAPAPVVPAAPVVQMMPVSQTYQQPALQPAEMYNQAAENKMSTPEPDEEEDVMKPSALAEDEPVDTLVENLEKDITEVWSYRDMFSDADKLGLDNEKVHNTYANLGSLSGLNLRRALNRALRGEDVGLAVVGGSISKGGPFSEKGLEYVLRSYFYAVEDWWNKIIRPVTGSSMIIRDVSIGGIATDYYSYCLQNHLPDDKLTNIVVWELSANDMKRYDDGLRPRPQPLEQFTRNVLSYRARPALVYLNFFALFEWDPDLAAHCRNFEDEGEDDIARYYKITSLSWRNMVCPLLSSGTSPLFTRNNLFAEDNFHPSILGHAQMAYILIDYIRTEFLKNLVKMRNTYIADAVARLQIPKAVYIPRPMFAETYTWKPLCHTYMLVDNRSPNNTLPVTEDNHGNFRYTIVREFKIRSDKIVGMDTNMRDQYIRYRMHVPPHPNGNRMPYNRLGIMSFTDDRTAEAQFDNQTPKVLTAKKKFLEGTIVKYVAEKITPGEHDLTIKSGPNGFLICAIVLG